MAAPRAHEVYGLRLTGVGGPGLLPVSTVAVPEGTGPHVDVRQVALGTQSAGVGTERAVLDLPEGRQLVLQRRAGTATYTGPPLSPDELVHPYLGAAASVFNRWAGREVFHAGAFVASGRAWAVVGRREAGKSTLLAALAARGVPVLADDLVVTDGRQAYSGPRTIDLRQPIPGHPGPLTPSRRASRCRLSLPPLPPSVPIGGWIYLRWGAETAMAAVPTSVLLSRLASRRSWSALPSDPRVLLDLAALPGWDLERPADWARMDAAVDLMLDQVMAASNRETTSRPSPRSGSVPNLDEPRLGASLDEPGDVAGCRSRR